MEQGFMRVDGRGKSGTDWFAYHHRYIDIWEQRLTTIFQPNMANVDRARAAHRYIRWYQGWAYLYLLRAPYEMPTTYEVISGSDRVLRCFLKEWNHVSSQHSVPLSLTLCPPGMFQSSRHSVQMLGGTSTLVRLMCMMMLVIQRKNTPGMMIFTALMTVEVLRHFTALMT